MTREEAIKDLKELLKWYLEEEPMSETVYKREAVSMAISALSENKGELISRQAVLDELEKWEWQELYLPIHFKQILDDVPSVENKGEWIPVSERLPEDQQNILFSTKTDRVFEGRYFDDNTGQQWYAFRDDCFAWNNVVTAWMPLPEPYKAEKGGE